jgi:glycosyltransferase involved in cell wall biosynthesis
MRQYDANIFLSEHYRDIDFAKKNHVAHYKIISNGASKEEFRARSRINIRMDLGIPDNHFLILNVSSHTGLKGHAEAIKIFRKAKLPRATFLLIGKKTKSLIGCYTKCKLSKSIYGKNIIIKDLTRQDTVAALKSADIFLFTSNVECSPIVLFESMAGRTPFLTTNVGNAKEIIKWSKGGVLLPTVISKSGFSKARIEESAKILKKFYIHRAKLSSMANAGYRSWLKRFTWEKVSKQYDSLYKSI